MAPFFLLNFSDGTVLGSEGRRRGESDREEGEEPRHRRIVASTAAAPGAAGQPGATAALAGVTGVGAEGSDPPDGAEAASATVRSRATAIGLVRGKNSSVPRPFGVRTWSA